MNGKMAKRLRIFDASKSEHRKLRRLHTRSGTLASQQPKPLPERKHRAKDPCPPTWPKTCNQEQQSRPQIVRKPVKEILSWYRNETGRVRAQVRARCLSLAKWQLDAAALQGHL